MYNTNFHQYHSLCPNCYSVTITTVAFNRTYFEQTCDKCGFCYTQRKTRHKIDFAKDLGTFSFRYTDDLFGIVTTMHKDSIISKIIVEKPYLDSFILNLQINRGLIDKAILNYLDKNDNELKEVDLLEFL